MVDPLSRQELIELAAPTCHECEEPIVRTEMPWKLVGATWKPTATMVCAAGHRVPVEPFEEGRP